jgi:glucokinase
MSDQGHRPPFYLGIDLGGTSIKSGVVDGDWRPLRKPAAAVDTPTNRGRPIHDEALDALQLSAEHAVEASGLAWSDIEAVGVGSPGTMDIPAGLLLEPPNLPGWDHFPIRQAVADRLKKPTTLQNDANAAAYAEYRAGAGRGTRSLVMFTLGTGIGGGIIEDGRIISGRHSHGAECGHIIIQMENARRCPCGGLGHLEAYASATSLVKRAHEALDRGEPSILNDRAAAGHLTARVIDEAAEAGDELAARLMKETAHYLAVGAVSLIHAIDPDIVVFGGGMTAAGPGFLDAIREGIRAMAFPVPAARVRVEYAQLGPDAGFIGAAGCARQEREATMMVVG